MLPSYSRSWQNHYLVRHTAHCNRFCLIISCFDTYANPLSSARLIRQLKNLAKEDGSAIVYFYCETSQQDTLQAANLFRSFSKQLLHYFNYRSILYPDDIKRKLDDFYQPTGPQSDADDAVMLFSALSEQAFKVFYVIDGLDEMECTQIPIVVSAFRALLKKTFDCKLFVSSRDELGTNVRLSLSARIQITQTDTRDNIRQFIDAEISRMTQDKRILTESDGTLQKMKDCLSRGAHGM